MCQPVPKLGCSNKAVETDDLKSMLKLDRISYEHLSILDKVQFLLNNLLIVYYFETDGLSSTGYFKLFLFIFFYENSLIV